MKMLIDNFGVVEVELFEVDNELLLCEFNYENKKYSGIIDKNNRVLVPFSSINLENYIFTMDRNNYCFERFSEGKNDYESFHLSKNKENGLFYLRKQFVSDEENSIRVTDTDPPKNSYWFVEITTRDITQKCLYDIRKALIITPAFDLISFETEKSRVLAYVEKGVYTIVDDEVILLASLSSFIDKDGNFLAPLYNPDADDFYDTLDFNYDKSFKHFNRVMDSIEAQLKYKFLEKRNYVEAILAQMYTNIYTEEEMKNSKCSAKILKFPSEVNNDKK